MKNLISLIKKIDWENRVFRTGFLQSKDICNEAEIEKIRLIKNIYVKYDNIFWVHDFNLYDNKQTLRFKVAFNKAFAQNKNWPEVIIRNLDRATIKINNYLHKVDKDWKKIDENNLIELFLEYVVLLKSIQRYYIVVPLSLYCESKISNKDIIQSVSVPYKELEVEGIKQSTGIINDFAWIKTAYNIIDKLTANDVKILKQNKTKRNRFVLPREQKHLIKALQITIYARNRIKELSQKLWYYSDPLLTEIASSLDLSRDDFLRLTYDEAIECLRLKKLVVSKKEIKRRAECFAVGFISGKKYVLSGRDAKSLVNFFGKRENAGNTIKGNIAFPGKIKGVVKVILGKNDFHKLDESDVLVAPMTTPDFVILMRKAGAIVTDEGGLSCHAAIVSRELKIPCIIGTKIATKVLKDGDKVEVDATRGVVKKL